MGILIARVFLLSGAVVGLALASSVAFAAAMLEPASSSATSSLSNTLTSSVPGSSAGAPLVTPRFCHSATEFRKSVEFLLADKDLSLREDQAVKLALEVAKGCDGASARFIKTYTLLKTAGVDQMQAMTTAISFAPHQDAQVEGFSQIFQKIFLENYLNLDFANAFKFALALSRDYRGDASRVKTDFVDLVKYCLSEKHMALDFSSCTEVTLMATKHSDLFPQGVFASFKKIYEYLRFDKYTGLSIKEALVIVPKVISKGPIAPENFIETMRYSLEKSTLRGSPHQAVKLALAVSDLSVASDAPALHP